MTLTARLRQSPIRCCRRCCSTRFRSKPANSHERILRSWLARSINKASMKKKATAKKPPEQKEPEMKVVERTYRGGCHCGRIRFEVRGALDRVSECNCSICTKKGYVH